MVDSINSNPFHGRMQNLAVYAYNEYRSPGVFKQASYDRAWAAALTLIAIVMVLNLVARLSTAGTKPRSADVEGRRAETDAGSRRRNQGRG